MTEYTWREFANANDAQKGDIIHDGSQIEYIQDLRIIPKAVEVIQPERKVSLKRYTHEFEWEDEPGAGFAFDCFQDGSLPENDRAYFEEVKAKPGLKYLGIFESERSFYDPAVIKCRRCGGDVVLDMLMTNTCEKCGSDYSQSGQLLAPREQWGWDTGESLSDILSADRSINDHEFSELDWDA